MEDEIIQFDIKVVEAFKCYGNNNIINGLHMEVRSGSIYGLLGASGCGKSTLLQCILGKMPIDSGAIEVKADSLKDIGYMPQNLCLEEALTIKEVFEYYGTLYSMTKEQIKRRIVHLNTFLELPDLKKSIKNLSGGQGRRVSLAVSILHDPKIIIFDEPTVGIDSVLRQKIWEELSSMVEHSRKTIIITTHYIEEATKADCIGLIRKGILVEEGTPQHIMMKYEANSLESAFTTLCCMQEDSTINQNNGRDILRNENVHKQDMHFIKSGSTIDFVRVKALLKKNARMLSRDILLLLLVFFLPIFQTTMFCYCIGIRIKDQPISVKNDEIKLSDCRHFKFNGCILDEANNQTMSCVVINYLLDFDYKLVEVNNSNTDEAIMKDHNSLVFLYFPKDYTENFKNYIGDDHTNYFFNSSMHVNIDNHNLIIKNQIEHDLINSVKHLINESLQACSNNPRSLNTPIDINVVHGKQVKTFRDYAAALYIVMIGFFLSSMFSVSFMLSEKIDGFLERSMFAGVRIMEVLISLFCIYTLIYIIQIIVTLFIVYVLFSNPSPVLESVFIFFTTILLVGWIGFFFGVLVVGLLSSKLVAVIFTHGFYMSLHNLSGVVWPISGQVSWLRPLSMLLPTTIAGHTLNDIVLKGWTWDHPSVMFNTSMMIAQLFLIILVLFGLGKVKKDTWILN